MSDEIKKEKSKTGIIYTVFTVIAIAVIGAFVFFKQNTDVKPVSKAEPVKAVDVKTTAPKEEKTVARIDISTKLADADKPQFEVYVDGSKTPEKQAEWMPKYNIQGNVVQKSGETVDIVIKALKDTDINLVLRGKWEQDENHDMIENWVGYTSVSVNGNEILQEETFVWHNKPFRYTINAKAGEEYKIHAEWTKADTVPEK